MQLIIKVRHTKLPLEIKEYAKEKIGEKCALYLDETDESIIGEIELDDQFGEKGGQDKRVDVTIALAHQHLPIHIEESDATFQEAIDKVAQRIEKALLRYKETRAHRT